MKSDVIVTQPIQSDFRDLPLGVKEIKENSSAEIVVIPNCYFSGYTPNFFYLKGNEGTITAAQCPELLIDCHDSLVMAGYSLGYSVEDLLSRLNASGGQAVHREMINRAEFSLNELEKREDECNISISDFIRDNYREIQLFYTYNHPNNSVIEELLKRVAEYLDFDFSFSVDFDPFVGTRLPIHNVLGGFFNFYSVDYHSLLSKKGELICTTEYIESMYNFYDKNIEIVSRNVKLSDFEKVVL